MKQLGIETASTCVQNNNDITR